MAAHRCLVSIALLISAVGDAEIETHRTSRETGSSVLLPGLKNGTEFKENMIYELSKVGANPSWLVIVHGEPQVQKFYETRGTFFPGNKSFLLTNLTKKDNGVYEQKLNQETLLRVILTVIDPVEEPVLRRQDDNETCRITLPCDAREGDSSNTTFFRNGDGVARNESSISSDRLLVIDGADPQHWGIYTCMVTNLVSRKVSRELVLIPEEMSGASLFFCGSCIGGLVCICHLLCLLFTFKTKYTCLLKDVLFYSKCVLGATTELTVFSIIIHLFADLRDQLSSVAGGIIVTVLSVVLLVRGLWSLMFCGVLFQSLIITVMEDVLLAADFLLVPAVFIVYIHMYLQASDLCGIRREQRLWTLFYLVIGFVIFLAVVLPLRILYVKCRKPDPPDRHKGSFTVAPTEEGTSDNINDNRRKNKRDEEETLTVEETPT